MRKIGKIAKLQFNKVELEGKGSAGKRNKGPESTFSFLQRNR